VIEEFSLLDLRDAEHVHANQHRARNLYLLVASRMDETAFVQLVYQARSLTKAQANVRRRAPYFFSTLTDILGMSEDEAGPRPPMGKARTTGGTSRSSPSASADI
jgi:hypothetical protein